MNIIKDVFNNTRFSPSKIIHIAFQIYLVLNVVIHGYVCHCSIFQVPICCNSLAHGSCSINIVLNYRKIFVNCPVWSNNSFCVHLLLTCFCRIFNCFYNYPILPQNMKTWLQGLAFQWSTICHLNDYVLYIIFPLPWCEKLRPFMWLEWVINCYLYTLRQIVCHFLWLNMPTITLFWSFFLSYSW